MRIKAGALSLRSMERRDEFGVVTILNLAVVIGNLLLHHCRLIPQRRKSPDCPKVHRIQRRTRHNDQ